MKVFGEVISKYQLVESFISLNVPCKAKIRTKYPEREMIRFCY